jgi:hypothetical protein
MPRKSDQPFQPLTIRAEMTLLTRNSSKGLSESAALVAESGDTVLLIIGNWVAVVLKENHRMRGKCGSLTLFN